MGFDLFDTAFESLNIWLKSRLYSYEIIRSASIGQNPLIYILWIWLGLSDQPLQLLLQKIKWITNAKMFWFIISLSLYSSKSSSYVSFLHCHLLLIESVYFIYLCWFASFEIAKNKVNLSWKMRTNHKIAKAHHKRCSQW